MLVVTRLRLSEAHLHGLCATCNPRCGSRSNQVGPGKTQAYLSLLRAVGRGLRFYIIGPRSALMNRKAVIAAIALMGPGSGVAGVRGSQ